MGSGIGYFWEPTVKSRPEVNWVGHLQYPLLLSLFLFEVNYLSIVKVSWSGGKDSTCALALHLERGDTVKAVCYIPMFTQTIPLISKEHYEFILRTADYFRSKGAEIHIVSGMTYYEYVTHRSIKGKYKGMIFGFPYFKKGSCGFKRDSKLKAIARCDVCFYDYEDIGIAADETDRHNQLNNQKRSILAELGFTENDATQFCVEGGLLSPHYKYNHRDGCSLCPHASEDERLRWFNDYPDAIPILIELQELVKRERPERTPLRNYRWFIEV